MATEKDTKTTMFQWLKLQLVNFVAWVRGIHLVDDEETANTLIMNQVLSRCMETGNMIYATVDEEGSLTMQEFPMPDLDE